MGLQITHRGPDGHSMLINTDVLDIAKRIQKGDATCGWSGDERMWVGWNPRLTRYEVWRTGEDGKDRIISAWAPNEFDARVIKNLAEHDTRVHDILARLDAHNAKIEKERADKLAEIMQEIHEFATWASRKLYAPGTDPAPYRGGK